MNKALAGCASFQPGITGTYLGRRGKIMTLNPDVNFDYNVPSWSQNQRQDLSGQALKW
jgi:hypothetical protein